MEDESQWLFPAAILSSLDFTMARNNFSEEISHLNPGPELHLRPLNVQDYSKGYMDLLAQLTTVGDVSFADFEGKIP